VHVQVNSIGESDAPSTLSQSSNDLLRDAGQSASAYMISGSADPRLGSESAKTLTLLSGSKLSHESGGSHFDKIPSSARNAASQGAGKAKTLFEKFKDTRIATRLGAVMGKLQLKAPIHLIDSMITYVIGVVSGMQDMAQVRDVFFIGQVQIHSDGTMILCSLYAVKFNFHVSRVQLILQHACNFFHFNPSIEGSQSFV